MYRALSLLALATLAGALAPRLAAQSGPGDPVRKPTFVRVLDAAGAAVANATVTFVGGMPHLGPEAAPTDVQVVASDARGRAQARLQAGLCYVAWAVGPADERGSGAASGAHGFFGAGALFDLRCDRPFTVRHIACEGTDAWGAFGPLRFFAVSQLPGIEQELPRDAEGRIAVPPWPQVEIEVRTRGGEPLWTAASSSEQIVIPPPQRLPVRVVDESGAPLAGATVRHRVGRRMPWRTDGLGGVGEERFRTLAVTPADGRVVVEVPYPADPLQSQAHGEMLLFASVAGRPAVAGGVFSRALYQDDRRVADWKGKELVFQCPVVAPLVGRFPGVPEGTVAHLAAVCKLFSERNSYTHDARSFTARVAADGRFQFDEVPAELHSCRLTLLPPVGNERPLPLFAAMSGRVLPPEVAEVGEARAVAAAAALGNLQVRVTDPGGGPARGVVAYLAPGEQRGVLFRDSVVRFPLDATGSATLRLAAGKWVVLAVSGQGHVASLLDLEAGERKLPLAMEPLATMRVRLRNRDGTPIVGANVMVRGSSTRATGDPVQSLLQSFATQSRAMLATLQTDREGEVLIPFVPVDGMTNRLCLQWPEGRTADFVLEPTDAPLELRPN